MLFQCHKYTYFYNAFFMELDRGGPETGLGIARVAIFFSS